MAELTEEQLLLLDNLMYYKYSTKENITVEDIANKIKKSVTKDELQGGMTVRQAQELADEIINNHPELHDLTVACSEDSTGFRAACFVDKDNNATIAVRGTGGSYEAWYDNVVGAYDTDTPIQEKMEKFLLTECANYDDITITGHSKGGNMAQYVTILHGDKIDRCVSFDGQGFNDEFLEKYAPEIIANQDKIKSICASGDFVNILLNSVAGETVYLNTLPGANAHSSFELYLQNKGSCNDDGVYVNKVEQDGLMKGLAYVADILVDNINNYADFYEKPLVNSLASVVGLIMSGKSGQFDWKNVGDFLWKDYILGLAQMGYFINGTYITDAMKNIHEELDKLGDVLTDAVINGAKNVYNYISDLVSGAGRADFCINIDRVKNQCEELSSCIQQLQRVESKLASFKIHGSAYGLLNSSIAIITIQVHKELVSLKNVREKLIDIVNCYTKAEKKIMSTV